MLPLQMALGMCVPDTCSSADLTVLVNEGKELLLLLFWFLLIVGMVHCFMQGLGKRCLVGNDN